MGEKTQRRKCGNSRVKISIPAKVPKLDDGLDGMTLPQRLIRLRSFWGDWKKYVISAGIESQLIDWIKLSGRRIARMAQRASVTFAGNYHLIHGGVERDPIGAEIPTRIRPQVLKQFVVLFEGV